jgi:gamma-glutamylcyclotransferase (GGCT)/AIG2-like uncharacterized protein YtfP
VSAEDAESLSRSLLSPQRRQFLLQLGVAYLCVCVVAIVASLVHLVKISTGAHLRRSLRQEVGSSLLSSLALLLPLYLLSGGLFSLRSPKTPASSSKGALLSSPSSSHPHLLFVYGTLKRGFHWNQKYLHSRGAGGSGATFICEATTRERHRLVVGDSGVPYLCLNTALPDEEAVACSCSATSSIEDPGPSQRCSCLCESCQHNIHRPRHSWTGDSAAVSLAATSLGASSSALWRKPSTVPSLSPPLHSALSSPSAAAGERIHGELWSVSAECLDNLDDYEGVSKQYYQRQRISVQLEDATNSLLTAEVYCLHSLPPDLANGPFLEEYSLSLHREFYRPVAHIQVKQLGYLGTISTWGTVTRDQLSSKGLDNVKN